MEEKRVCPLGGECFEIKDNIPHRCAWHVKLQGKDPQSEEMIDRWDCAMVWQTIIMLESNQRIHGMSQATEGLRNVNQEVGVNLANILMKKQDKLISG